MAKAVEYEVVWSYRDGTDRDQIDRIAQVKATNAMTAGNKAIRQIAEDMSIDRRDIVVTDISRWWSA